MGGGELN